MSDFLKKHFNIISMALVCSGAILLMIQLFFNFPIGNLLLIFSLILVVMGVVLYVRFNKSGSKY
ncbi:MAG: hypothetical protein IJ562_01450 [Prevotella sp.]|nr:hypothetical protein [Prevotella sp.]